MVCDSIGPSTYESVGASDVNSRSKLAVSLASTYDTVSNEVHGGCSGSTYHTGLEAGLILPLEQLSPVNAVEEVMCLDLSRALGS
jgi:hypothetical protein